ncbi:MAG: hypothetical protein WCO11_08065 [Sphingomonadales bacterium]
MDGQMLTRSETPKTKQELIQSLQRASIRSIDVYEGIQIAKMPSKADLERMKASVIILKS